MTKIIFGFLICTILIFSAVIPVTSELHIIKTKDVIENLNLIIDEYSLPPPISIDMVLEESICRRMSVRSFTGEAITDEELSTILWAAYGYTENDTRSIFNPDGTYSTIIYVIRSDATYKYVPEDHSLSLYKNGNYLYLGQYTSPIKFGLVWDMNIESDEMIAMADIGMIAQNIYFDANALDLGTVTTGGNVGDLYELGLPSNEKPEIIMPLGHPSSAYDFTYDPRPGSNLPEIINNTYSLEDSINNRLISYRWDNNPLSDVEQSQLIWSSYGYSYLYDNLNNKWHRTLPSAIGIYPFNIYAVNQDGVYEYIPSTHSISTIIQGDRREEINNSIESSDMWITSATWIIIPFYNTNVYPQYLTWWYYENGAIIHNILLEATALNLCANVIYDITDEVGLRSALGISGQTNLLPLSVVPVGNPFTSPPEKPEIEGPTIGAVGIEYEYSVHTTDPDEDDVYYYIEWGDGQVEEWIGPYNSGVIATINHTWVLPDDYEIRAKAKDINDVESEWSDIYLLTIVENEPPSIPDISGPPSGNVGTSYTYTFTSTDSDGDQVSYYIKWDDGSITDWTTYQASGPPGYNGNHVWDEQGTYTIEAKAKDVYNVESNLATLDVIMPRYKILYNPLILKLQERFANMFPILQYIFRL